MTTWDLRRPPLKLFTGDLVEMTEIKNYQGEYYQSCLQIYNRYKRFGLPFAGGWWDASGAFHSGGWADHPEYVIQIIELISSTLDRFERWRNGNR